MLHLTGHFKGNGYLELNRSAVVKSANENEVLIAVLFSTSQPNGLLIWYGQKKSEQYNGQDFVALAIVEGFLEYAFRLNSEETLIKNVYSRVDDGVRHVAIIKRTGNQASLELDGLSLHGESRPTNKKESYMPGNTFIGKHQYFSIFFIYITNLMLCFFFIQVAHRIWLILLEADTHKDSKAVYILLKEKMMALLISDLNLLVD